MTSGTGPRSRAARTASEPVPYYPVLLCHAAPLPPRDPAPKDGCACAVCEHFHRPRAETTWTPVVIRREPFHGELRRS